MLPPAIAQYRLLQNIAYAHDIYGGLNAQEANLGIQLPLDQLYQELEKLRADGLIERKQGRYYPTDQGRDLVE